MLSRRVNYGGDKLDFEIYKIFKFTLIRILEDICDHMDPNGPIYFYDVLINIDIQ